jgi:hypothetical protein
VRRRVRRVRLGRNVFLFVGGWVLLIHEMLGPGRDAFVAGSVALILASVTSHVATPGPTAPQDQEAKPSDDADSGHRQGPTP